MEEMARAECLVVLALNAERHDALERGADDEVAFTRVFVAARHGRALAILRTKLGQNTCPIHRCPWASRFHQTEGISGGLGEIPGKVAEVLFFCGAPLGDRFCFGSKITEMLKPVPADI